MDKFVSSGPEDISGIPHESHGKLFFEIFNTFDENGIAVVDVSSSKSLTYKQLCQLSKNLAATLRIFGVTKNDIVALVAENSREFVVAYLAALFLGVPVHLFNPHYTEYELDNILNLSEPLVVICTKKSHQQVTKVVKELNFVKMNICLDVEKMSKQVNVDFQIENLISEDDVAVICNSSGTTGLPKGVMITHAMLRLQTALGGNPNVYGLSPGKTVIAVLPSFHIYALSIVNGSLYSGATLVVLDKFAPITFLETIQKYKPERLFLVPTLVNFLLKSPEVGKYDLTSVRQISSGGSSLCQEYARILKQKFHLEKLQVGYGMTETGAVLHTTDGLNGSSGQTLHGYHVKVVDLTTGANLPPLQTGEICIKGAIMKGYVNNLEKTNEIIDSDGFLHSGDVGYYDKNGFFYISGRIKDIIKYKSYQVSPFELEDILTGMAGIKEVAVVGKPDSRFGELPTAFVVKEEGVEITQEEICAFLAERVSNEKRLHGGVKFVEMLPKNSTGKVLRDELLKLTFQETGLM